MTGGVPDRRGRPRRSGLAAALLLLGRHEEHAVDLVRRSLVLDPVGDAPNTPQPPLVAVRSVVEQQLLRFDVHLGALLLVGRGAPLDDALVERGVAVLAVVLAALKDV